MPLSQFEIEFSDGRKRVKQLDETDRKAYEEMKGIKSIKKVSDKSRTASADK